MAEMLIVVFIPHEMISGKAEYSGPNTDDLVPHAEADLRALSWSQDAVWLVTPGAASLAWPIPDAMHHHPGRQA